MAQAQTTERASQVVESGRFSFMTEKDVRNLSFLKVTIPTLLDNVERPVPGGLYDPVMGPLDDRTACKSCGQLRLVCPGHCGHIELVYPIYHPLLFNLLYNFLQRTCFFCHHFRARAEEVEKYVSQLKFIMKGDSTDSSEECEDSDMKNQNLSFLQTAEVIAVLESFMSLTSKKCNKCGAKNPKLEKYMFGWVRMNGLKESDIGATIIRGLKVKKSTVSVENPDDFDDRGIDALSEFEESDKEKREKSTEVSKVFEEHKDHSRGDLLPSEVREILKDLWDNEFEFCSFIGGLWQSGSEKIDYTMFFLESVLVPPTKFRTPIKGGYNVMVHFQTVGLNKVLVSNINLGNACTNKLDQSEVVFRWMILQESVNICFDRKTATVTSQEDSSGIVDLLEKNGCLFRQKMGRKYQPTKYRGRLI